MNCDRDRGTVQFIRGIKRLTYIMPHMWEDFKGVRDLQLMFSDPMRLNTMRLMMRYIIVTPPKYGTEEDSTSFRGATWIGIITSHKRTI